MVETHQANDSQNNQESVYIQGSQYDPIEIQQNNNLILQRDELNHKPVATPQMAGSRNNFNSNKKSILSLNRTPLPGVRQKHEPGVVEPPLAELSKDASIQRMVSLQLLHGSQASRIRGRHASASVDSQLNIKLRQDMDNIFDREDSQAGQVLESKRFMQKWSTSKQSVTSLQSVLNKGSRSLTRQQLAKNYAQKIRSGELLPSLSPAGNLGQGSSVAPFRRGSNNPSPSVLKTGGHILNSLADGLDDEDASYFERGSNIDMSTKNYGKSLKIGYQNDITSRVSQQIDQVSSYHMDLLEEKRGEIQSIIKRRHQKMSLSKAEPDEEDKPRLGAFNVKLQPNGALFPEIIPKVERKPIVIGGNTSLGTTFDMQQQKLLGPRNFEKLKKYDRGESDSDIALSQRAPGALNDLNEDKEDLKIEKLRQKVNQDYDQKPKITMQVLNYKETRPNREPDLETKKRARKKGVETTDRISPEKQKLSLESKKQLQQRSERKVVDKTSPSKQSQLTVTKSNLPATTPKKLQSSHHVSQRSEVEKIPDPISNVLGEDNLNDEFKLMTDKFIDKKFSPRDKAKPNQTNKMFQSSLVKIQVKKDKDFSNTQGFQDLNKLSPNRVHRQSRLSPASRRSPESKKSPRKAGDSSSSSSTPEETAQLDSNYKIMQGIVEHKTALRIQKKILRIKKKEAKSKIDFKSLLIESTLKQEVVDKESSLDSSKAFAKEQLDNFNSELDIYSEIGDSHHFGLHHKKRSMHHPVSARNRSHHMKAIPAEDSEEERGSESKGSESGDGQEDDDEEEEEVDEYEQEQAKRNSALDERAEIKKTLMEKETAKKEDDQLCGPRLTKKIDDFILEVSVEAGLADQERPAHMTGKGGEVDMLRTGNTSIFQLEKTKNDDQGAQQKVMDKYLEEFRGQQAFFQICKMAKDSKFTDPAMANPRIQYFNECTKANSVAKSILSKIIDKQLLLRDLKLNVGDSSGLHESMMNDPNLVSKIYLDNCGLDDNKLATILEGFNAQSQTISLRVQGNVIEQESVQQILDLLKRKVPDNLHELHIMHTKFNWQATEDLLRGMRQRNYLRKLSLVSASLNDYSLANLCEVIRTQKTLTTLDISWNQLTPKQMKPLLTILQKNRRLTDLNLSWNSIMESGKEDSTSYENHVHEVNEMLGKIIKHSKTIIHMNLTGTGLSSGVIYEMGNCLRRARSLLCLHLSGNPGLTQENFEYLGDRIRGRAREDIERFTRVSAVVKEAVKVAGISSNIISGVREKVNRDTEFKMLHKSDPIETSANDQLIFQRMLGHKEEQPGSGQWYESSKEAVACKPHYKNECWICQGHVYSFLFWSKGMAYKLSPIFSKDKTEEIRWHIDRDFGEQETADLQHENTNVKYKDLENQVPYICGSFTGWRYKKMTRLDEFNRRFEEDPIDAFSIACSNGKIRKRVVKREQCNEYEESHCQIAEGEERLRYTYAWRHFFAKNLRYKRPYVINSHLFYERPSKDGTLPEEDLVDQMGEIQSESSEDQTEQEEEKEVDPVEQEEQKKIKLSEMLPYERDAYFRQLEEEKKKPPLPNIPDQNKFDKVYILPMFCKPGKHQYMIKYKDEDEFRQKHLIKKINKQVKRYEAGKNNQPVSKAFDKAKYRKAKIDLAPECFFYQCDVPKRSEDIPSYSKTMTNKIVEREFNKEMSVFAKWRADTPSSLAQAFNEDIKNWKGYRFIKSEEDKADTELVLKKYFQPLKEIFLHVASQSSWPNIGSLDFCDLATKAKFLDQYVNISSCDRTYIAANLKVDTSSAPSNGLKRFEFLESIVRLSNIKYLEPKIVKTYAEATEKLITECMLPNFHPEPWQEWRDKELWTMDVNDIFESNLDNLKRIYDRYRTPTKQLMDHLDCIDLCTRDAQLSITEKDILFCFGYCHMTVLNEEKQWKTYHSLQFVEFLEFLGRIAHFRFRSANAEVASLPLTNKIEIILDDLMQGFGLVRNEVNVEVEEFSESDDDY